jgi:hypothetical protein
MGFSHQRRRGAGSKDHEMSTARKSPAEDERLRRKGDRQGPPTEADAPSPGPGRGRRQIPGQTNIWEQLDWADADRRQAEEPPAA